MDKKMKIISICGSPRKGNSESVILKCKELLEKKGIENEIILLRNHKIQRCEGCVEYCNKHFSCCHQDDMASILEKMIEADGYIFVSPNYFAMPPGIFKDFMDKCSVLYTSYYFTKKPDLSQKKAIVLALGSDKKSIDACRKHIAKRFVETLRIKTISQKSFLSNSELNGNYDNIFEDNANKNIIKKMIDKLCK